MNDRLQAAQVEKRQGRLRLEDDELHVSSMQEGVDNTMARHLADARMVVCHREEEGQVVLQALQGTCTEGEGGEAWQDCSK